MSEIRKYQNIDALRTFGCLAIIAWHVLSNGKFNDEGFCSIRLIPSFNYLVYLFMIISGFGMCNGYYQKLKSGTYDLNKFYSRRYHKIVPFFALLIVLNCIMEFKWQTIFEGIMEITMLFGFLPNNTLSVIGVSWTLGVIFVFYIIFPFIVFLLNDKRRGWLSFLVALVITFMCQTYFMTEKFVAKGFVMRHSFLFCLPFFLCGGLIYLYRDTIINFVNKYKKIVFASNAILIFVYLITPDEIDHFSIIAFKALFLYSVLVCSSLGKANVVLSNRFTSFVSEISMELYLSHMVAFRLVEKMHVPQLFGNTLYGYLFTYVSVVVVSVIGIVIYRKVENLIKKKLCQV